MPEVILGSAVVVILVVLIRVSARRQRTGHPIWGWLAQLHVLLPPAALIYVAIAQLVRANAAVGIVLLALGLLLGVPALGYVRTVSSQLRASPPGVMTEGSADAMADFMLKRMGILLISAIVLGIAAVIWAIVGGFN